MEELVFAERNNFRTKNNIDQTTTLFFVSPGSNEAEAKKSVPICYKALDQFIDSFGKEQGLTADNFAVVVSVPAGEANLKAIVNTSSPKCRKIVVETPEERYSAMAASDLAACMNGETIGECVGMQLPTLVMDNHNWWDAYHTALYNEFNSDYAIALKGETYPELYNMMFSEKLCQLWGEIYTNPKMKYHWIKRHERILPKFLPEADMSTTTSTQLVREGMSFREFEEPNAFTAKRMLELAAEWQEKRSSAEYKEFYRGLFSKGSVRA